MKTSRHFGKSREPVQRGSVLSEYVAVIAGLLILFTGLSVIVDFVVEHSDEYAAALRMPY